MLQLARLGSTRPEGEVGPAGRHFEETLSPEELEERVTRNVSSASPSMKFDAGTVGSHLGKGPFSNGCVFRARA